MTRAAGAGIAAVLMAVLTGCSTSVPGTVVMTTVPAPAGEVDLALLDPGNYPTKPQPALGKGGDNGGFLEGARMGANVLGPWQVDPTLTTYPQAGERPSNFAMPFSVAATKAAQNHKLVAVFTTSRSSTAGGTSLVNAVMRFASPEDAAAAAAEMTDASTNAEVFGDVIAYDPIPIPRYPATSGLVHFWDTLNKWAVEAFTAHGPYVLSQYADSNENAEAAAELAAATLDKQGPLIDQYKPTPTDQIKDLPIDPDGLLARTLPPDKGNGAIYQPQTQLHFDTDPIGSQQLFNDAHLQEVAKGRVNVYQTPDAGSAQKIADAFIASIAKSGSGSSAFVPAAGVKGLPASKCLTRKGTTAADTAFYCMAVVDRYAIEVSAAQERDTHQQISAQYLMLTGK